MKKPIMLIDFGRIILDRLNGKTDMLVLNDYLVEDAIPVEWIKKYIAEEGIYPNRELLSVEQADAIERMIENWEKENETD